MALWKGRHFECSLFQLVVQEVGIKFAQSHFARGVRSKNVLVLSHIVMEYIKVRTCP
jgi:hypothetical protein